MLAGAVVPGSVSYRRAIVISAHRRINHWQLSARVRFLVTADRRLFYFLFPAPETPDTVIQRSCCNGSGPAAASDLGRLVGQFRLWRATDQPESQGRGTTNLFTQPPREGRPSSYADTTRAPAHQVPRPSRAAGQRIRVSHVAEAEVLKLRLKFGLDDPGVTPRLSPPAAPPGIKQARRRRA